jgi:hypothetical protein
MVQLKIHTNFVNLKFSIAGPSLGDCLERNGGLKSGLAIKGTVKYVSNWASNRLLALNFVKNKRKLLGAYRISLHLSTFYRLILFRAAKIRFRGS